MDGALVLSEGIYEQIAEDIPRRKSKDTARQIKSRVENKFKEADSPEQLFENKIYQGYHKNLKQIRIGSWRIVAKEMPNFDLCEVVILFYIYEKGDEPSDQTMEKICDGIGTLNNKFNAWDKSKQSAWLDEWYTELP